MNKRFSKKILMLSTAVMVFALLCTIFVGASAASFSGGSGTKKDPYLLKTAKDVQAMKGDLDAHYKLAATIDLSSIKEFEPVGCLGAPFKGSITCDLGADGLPRYALLNLNVYNHAGEIGNHVFAQCGPGYYTDYDKNGFSKYESGLFGATDGATLKNILVFKAKVKSTAVGQHEGVWYGGERRLCAEQVAAQGTAILVGIAKNSTITGCGTQGEITSDSNSTAGLVGKSIGSNISYSWADINNKTRGFWYSAGLVGAAQDSTTISYCYSKGEIDCTSGKIFGLGNGQCGSGLVTYLSVDSMISDSYSSVNFTSRSVVNGTFSNPKGDTQIGTTTNCFSTGVIKGVNAVIGASENASNCWTLNAPGQFQSNYKLGSAADIKAAFSSAKGWDTSGQFPIIKAMKYIKDYSIFVAGKERDGAGAATSQNSTTSNGSEATSDETQSTANGNEQTGEDKQGESQTIVQSGYKDSNTYIVLFVCLTAVVVCVTAASFCLLFKSVQKVKVALKDDKDDKDDVFSNSTDKE